MRPPKLLHASSNLAQGSICVGSPTGRGRELKIRDSDGFESLATHHALVPQSAEGSGSNPVQFWFESRVAHHFNASLAETV